MAADVGYSYAGRVLVAFLALILVGYVTDGRRWATGRCELNIAAYLLTGPWQAVVQSAMDAWSNAGGAFAFVDNPASPNVVTTYDQGPWNGRLANTLIYPAGRGLPLSDVRIQVNTYYCWDPPHAAPLTGRDPSGDVYALENVVRHELGHVLYLGHSSDPNATMYDAIRPGTAIAALSPDDVAAVQALYP